MDLPLALNVNEGGVDNSPTEAIPAMLHQALLDSRQRWRDLATLSADIVFETDAQGNLVFISPNPALGWPCDMLLARPAEHLLAEPANAFLFNPFRPTAIVRRRRAWLRRPNGETVCVSFASAPLLDASGRIVGARGIGQDVTDQDGIDTAVAAALRRGEVIDHILHRMGKEVMAQRMMQSALEALMQALGAEGCAVADLLGGGGEGDILHQAGAGVAVVLPTIKLMLETMTEECQTAFDPSGRPLLVCPSQTRFGEHAGLALWRARGGREWGDEEQALAASATTIIRVILEHESIQREMGRQARIDALTGLSSRRSFIDEMTRRVDRLERDNRSGTLMIVNLDKFRELNERRGHDTGDEALRAIATLLTNTFRPGDLLARFSGDHFAVWLDGADELTTAERAESLRIEGPAALAHLTEPAGLTVTLSIGIAPRWPGTGEDVDSVLHRADQALSAVKRMKPGHWFVANVGLPA